MINMCHQESLLASSFLLACTLQAAYLAEQHSDRATRLAANEFLHAVTLWIVGEQYAALPSASSDDIQHFTERMQLGLVLALCSLFTLCVPCQQLAPFRWLLCLCTNCCQSQLDWRLLPWCWAL